MQQEGNKRKQDMSIEEILNSIRGVIDGSPVIAAESTLSSNKGQDIEESSENDDTNKEILELTNIVTDGVLEPKTYINAGISCNNNETKADLKNGPQGHLSQNTIKAESNTLISDEVASKTSRSIQDFASSAKSVIEESAKLKSMTVEELVTQSIKPMLQEWLNKNLPLIVREIVTLELKKLIPNEGSNKNKDS